MRTHAQTYQHNKHINGPFLASHSLACAFTLTLSFFPSLPHKYQLTQIQNDDCCFICCFNVLLYFTFFSSLSLSPSVYCAKLFYPPLNGRRRRLWFSKLVWMWGRTITIQNLIAFAAAETTQLCFLTDLVSSFSFWTIIMMLNQIERVIISNANMS